MSMIRWIVGDKPGPWVALVVVGVLGLIVALALGSCGAEGGRDAEAQRLAARALLAEAEARADAQRASTRQMERDAAQARALATLPYVVVVVGAVGLAGLAGLIFWDLRTLRSTPAPPPDPVFLAYIERAWQVRAEQDRAILERLNRIEHQALGAGEKPEVVIYRDR